MSYNWLSRFEVNFIKSTRTAMRTIAPIISVGGILIPLLSSDLNIHFHTVNSLFIICIYNLVSWKPYGVPGSTRYPTACEIPIITVG